MKHERQDMDFIDYPSHGHCLPSLFKQVKFHCMAREGNKLAICVLKLLWIEIFSGLILTM